METSPVHDSDRVAAAPEADASTADPNPLRAVHPTAPPLRKDFGDGRLWMIELAFDAGHAVLVGEEVRVAGES